MSIVTKDDLHRLIDELADEEVQAMYATLRAYRTPAQPSSCSPRPLGPDDIVLAEPVMPDDETADELIATVRRWRREGGYA